VKLNVRLAKGGSDGGVVLEVAGQPIELVDNEAVDGWVIREASQHGLELRPVGAAGRFPSVHVLVGELPTLIGDEPSAGLGLGGDRVALSACSFVETRR